MSESTFHGIAIDGKRGYGPRATLLTGFATEEIEPLRDLLDQAGAGDVRMLLCTQGMLNCGLSDALRNPVSELPLPPDKLPRVMVLSGMGGEEIHFLLDNFIHTKLQRPIFATLTPGNTNFIVRDLLAELLREHRAMQAEK